MNSPSSPLPRRALCAGALSLALSASAAVAQGVVLADADGTAHAYVAVAVPGGVTWSQANAAAANAGGYLVTISTEQENSAVHALLASASFWSFDSASNTWSGPWIGGVQSPAGPEPAGGWGWAEIQPFTFQKWTAGQPDNDNNADRIHFGATANKDATWADAPESERMPGFIIEFSGPGALRTLGLLNRSAGSFDGYTLLAPGSSRSTFLLDPRGRTVNTWTSQYNPGQVAYLLPDGNLLRAGKLGQFPPPAGGDGGIVEEFDWQGNLVWSFTHSTATYVQHHDLERLPNGNTLMIVWDYKSGADAIAAGRDPATMKQGFLWPDKIIEVQKTGPQAGKIVWEWHVWDHLIQDFDSTKSNYGDPAKHPERVDINYAPDTIADWMHTNAISYNPKLDQVMISVRSFEELWIIDHSTTTQEAAGSTGGRSGKGGDLLYRWGNPAAYRAGGPSDKQLFLQHDTHWIPAGLPGGGNIMVFNNGRGRPGGDESTVDEIVPPTPDANGNYPRNGAAWGPSKPVWTYRAADPERFFSGFVSGAQRQPNGNTLICAGWVGLVREVTSQGNVVWEYANPFFGGVAAPQGTLTAPSVSNVFRAPRYAPDYPAFTGRTLTPREPLERHDTVLLADGSTAPHRVATGETVDLTLRALGGAGLPYLVATSATPGLIPVDHRFARVGIDPVLEASLFQNLPIFGNYRGTLSAANQQHAQLNIPAIPALSGLKLFTMFAVLEPTMRSGIAMISNTVEVTIF